MLNPNSQGKIYLLYHEERSLFDIWFTRILIVFAICCASVIIGVSLINLLDSTYTLSECGKRKITNTYNWNNYIQIKANADLCLLNLVK